MIQAKLREDHDRPVDAHENIPIFAHHPASTTIGRGGRQDTVVRYRFDVNGRTYRADSIDEAKAVIGTLLAEPGV